MSWKESGNENIGVVSACDMVAFSNLYKDLYLIKVTDYNVITDIGIMLLAHIRVCCKTSRGQCSLI